MNNKLLSINHKHSKGFTLVELIIYMGILSILIMIITTIFLSSLEIQLDSESSSSLDQDMRFLYSRVEYDLKRADSVSTPSTLGQATSTLEFVVSGNLYTYSVDANGNLNLSDGITTQQVNSIGTTVTSLSFQRLGNVGGNHAIRYSYTLQSRVQEKSGVEEKTFESSVGFR